jgi:hypothetical protein
MERSRLALVREIARPPSECAPSRFADRQRELFVNRSEVLQWRMRTSHGFITGVSRGVRNRDSGKPSRTVIHFAG